MRRKFNLKKDKLILISFLTMTLVVWSFPLLWAGRGISKPGGIWHEPVTGMAFVWVPGGCFQMGSPSGEAGRDPDEGLVHKVCVDGFWMGKTEVTNAQYRQFKIDHVSQEHRGFSLNRDDQPVVYMSWHDAKAFAKWLNEQNHKRYHFRLPTEAEWEYACRAETTTARYWGDDPDKACEYANVGDLTAEREWPYWEVNNCEDGYEVTAPVGSFTPNAFGLYDMLGNVFEWNEDIYGKDAYGNHQRNNPVFTGDGSYRVIRGGCWYSWPAGVRCAGRSDHPPNGRDRDYFLGFRLVRIP
ncbi:MAG: formylglycine-generating enzyme family protein [Candidatus Desulfatibia sp.]|uniref:formylglycine-generating enzyme family protein n=1 Tax=Candidatus Desulfatibia sp. TaxID=3101189 RepID=UPI002F3108F5